MRFVAGRGAVAELLGGAAGRECHGEEDGGTVVESHREAFAGQRHCGGEPSEKLAGQGAAAELQREEATAGKVRKGVPLPARRDCSGATGWSLFFDAPLMQIIPIFVVW